MTRPASRPAAEQGRQRDLDAARRVLRLAGEGLAALASGLDAELTRALDLIDGRAGKIVVTGMGKSGHVGRKIAATLASTGAPSHYVHPAEASHGDLGMIAAQDVVLALSNSGETAELKDMIAYTRLLRIPLVAIVGRGGSSLAEAADAALVLPPAPEACPLGLAPTTSTTMMLALGDALAVALMERRGFSPDQFQVLHPGGRLGSRFIRVEDVMHGPEELPLTAPQTPMAEAIIEMTRRSFGCVGVLDPEGRLAGIVTDGDLRRHMSGRLLELTAGEVMTREPKTIRPGALAAEALGAMQANQITCLFVVEDGAPKGIVHVHDILRAGIA
jgi:arabinose-5-phosphate isomerase